MRILKIFIAALMLTTGVIYAQAAKAQDTHLQKATFAGGCFWCMQPVFDHTKGVISTLVGYTGGHVANPGYEDVSSGETGHAESIEITFDPNVVSYERLLTIFWHNIDPTAVNSQFVDYGTQYRSAIFYHNEEQRLIAEKSKAALAASGRFENKPIVTEIVPATTFYPAEEFIEDHWGKNN